MASEEIHITLNPLDYIAPRNYVRLIFPIPLKPGAKDEEVFHDLSEALHKTFVQEPWASGKVFRQTPNTKGWRPGQLEIRHSPCLPGGPRPHQLKYQRLDTKWTYDDLRGCGFPSGVFPEDILLHAPRLGDVDEAGASVFLSQANFLAGGLLLGMTTSHAATDGGGMFNIMNLWAENFRELYRRDVGGRITPSPFTAADRDRSIPDKIWQRASKKRGNATHDVNDPWLRALACLDSHYGGDNLQDEAAVTSEEGIEQNVNNSKANGFNLNGNAVNGNLTNEGDSRIMLNRVMFLSSVDQTALEKKCSAEPLPAGASQISLGDCINALFWRCTMRARAAVAKARSTQLDEVSVFESPVDVRGVFGSDLPHNYLGGCFLMNSARIPLQELISTSTPLGRIAQALRQGAAKVTTSAVHDAYGLVQSTSDLSCVRGRFMERPDSADMLLSNVIALPLGGISFGDRYFENGGTPHVLRILHGPYAPYVRLGHVLPRNAKHGGVELSVNLFDDEMPYLDADEEFNRYLVTIEGLGVSESRIGFTD